jgi:hypothetical protein
LKANSVKWQSVVWLRLRLKLFKIGSDIFLEILEIAFIILAKIQSANLALFKIKDILKEPFGKNTFVILLV